MGYAQSLLIHSMSPRAGPVLNGFFLLLLARSFPCSSEDHPWPRSFRGASALAWVTLGCSPLRLSPLWYGSPLCPKMCPSLWLLHASAQKHLPMCPLPFVAAAFSEMHLSRDTTFPFNGEVLAGNGLLTLVSELAGHSCYLLRATDDLLPCNIQLPKCCQLCSIQQVLD